MAWGLFPLFFMAAQLTTDQIGVLVALYPATWGVMQLFTGALSDRIGRKWLIASGMWIQAAGIAGIALSNTLLGYAAGTAFVYPTLLAVIGDVAHPTWRASAVGVYRFWRDLGYAIGALLAGIIADALGLTEAILFVAVLTFASGLVIAIRQTETLPKLKQPRPISAELNTRQRREAG